MKMKMTGMILILSALAAAPAAAEPMEVEAYPVRTAQAGMLRDIVEELLGADGMVVADETTGRIIVVAPARQQERIREALERIDLAAPNIRIRVSIQADSSGEDRHAGLSGPEGITVTPRNGGYRIRLEPHVRHHNISGSSSIQQNLMLQSGSTARLFVGQEAPVLEWIMGYARRYGYIEQRVTRRPVGASLAVTARVMDDGSAVRVRLTPEISSFVNGVNDRIAITRAEVEVTVPNGTSRNIAGFGEHTQLYNRYLAGISGRRSSANMSMVLTATIEKP